MGQVIKFTPKRQRRNRPRRPPSVLHGVLPVILGLTMVLGIGWATSEAGPLTLRVTPQTPLVGRVRHVRDGDTIEIGTQAIRIAALDCAERGTADGARATKRMRELVATGAQLTCNMTDRTSYDRKVGSCKLPDGRDLAEIMITQGYCTRYL